MVTAYSAIELIQEELRSLTCRKFLSGNDFRVQCPFHEGDKNPSLGVNLSMTAKVPLGFYHCFGCGAKGPWNRLAKQFGLRELASDVKETETNGYASVFPDIEKRLLGHPIEIMPNTGTPFHGKSWRGVSGRMVRRAQGILAVDWGENVLFLWLPVVCKGKTVMALKARMKKKRGKPSYLFHDPGKVERKPWYGYDLASDMLKKGDKRSVFLVEGARDALKLMDAGIPALALLGSRQWNKRKLSQLLSLRAEYNAKPVVMMDADSAGVHTQKTIVKDLRNVLGSDVNEVKLGVHADKLGLASPDPADLPDWFLDRIKAACD